MRYLKKYTLVLTPDGYLGINLEGSGEEDREVTVALGNGLIVLIKAKELSPISFKDHQHSDDIVYGEAMFGEFVNYVIQEYRNNEEKAKKLREANDLNDYDWNK